MSEHYIVGEKIDTNGMQVGDWYYVGEHIDGIRVYGATPGNSTLTVKYTNEGGSVIQSGGTVNVPEGEYDDVFYSCFIPANHDFYVKVGTYSSEGGDYFPVFSTLTLDPAEYITEHIATITVDGSAEVKFVSPQPVYGIYGENIKASLNEDFEDTDQGVYDTADTGKATIAHYTGADRLYLTGSGTVKVWGGQSPLDDPFGV